MKIIFLDIDGVLNVCRPERDKWGRLFHQDFIKNLKDIIEKTNARIVITSTWRADGLEEMRKMWRQRQLPGEVLDITPFYYNYMEDPPAEKPPRGFDIRAWLETRSDIDVTHYVILDDNSDVLPEQSTHLVKTADNHTHQEAIEGYGLTRECANKALGILING